MAAKLFFVFLAVLAAVFFFTMTVGARRNESSSAQDDPPPAWIGSLIGPLSPKLSLPQKEFHFAADNLTVQAPAADSQFRNATFRVVSGCRAPADCSNIDIAYKNESAKARQLNLHDQHWHPSKNKPDQASLVIFPEGGPLYFHCTAVPSCTAVLQ